MCINMSANLLVWRSQASTTNIKKKLFVKKRDIKLENAKMDSLLTK